MMGTHDDEWCANGRQEVQSPGAIAELRKFSSSKREDDQSILISGASNKQSSSGLQGNMKRSGRRRSPNKSQKLKPLAASPRMHRSAGDSTSPKDREAVGMRVRPSTKARAEWRMQIDDPLYIKARKKPGKVEFSTTLLSPESVKLFDLASHQSVHPETHTMVEVLTQTGGRLGRSSSAMTHENQALQILRQARLLTSAKTGRNATGRFGTDFQESNGNVGDETRASSTSDYLPSGDQADNYVTEARNKASVHQAVLRLLSQSVCCSAHSAMLTDVATFYQTFFVDSMNAVQTERLALRKGAEKIRDNARDRLDSKRTLLIRRTSSARNVVQRMSEREEGMLKKFIFVNWKQVLDSSKRARGRKQHSRAVVCRALMRRDRHTELMVRFMAWLDFSRKKHAARKAAEDVESMKIAQKKVVNKLKKQLQERELEAKTSTESAKKAYKMLSSLQKASLSLLNVLGSAMEAAKQAESRASIEENAESEVEEKNSNQSANLESSNQSEEIEACVRNIGNIEKQMLNEFAVIVCKMSSDNGSQTLLSSVGGDREQEVQTELNCSDLDRMEISSAKWFEAEARHLAKIETDRSKEQQTEIGSQEWLEIEAAAQKYSSTTMGDAGTMTSLSMVRLEQAMAAEASIRSLKGNRIATNSHLMIEPSLQPDTTHASCQTDLSNDPLNSGNSQFLDSIEDSAFFSNEFSIYDQEVSEDTLQKFLKLQEFFGTCTVDAASEFSDRNIFDLVGLLDIHEVQPGDKIIQQGEEATWFGVLLEGQLDVLVNENKVAMIGPGAVMGELGFLEEGHGRTATCVAHSSGLVAAIPYRRIMTLHETSRDLHTKFMLLVAESGVEKLQSTVRRLSGNLRDLKDQVLATANASADDVGKTAQDKEGLTPKEEQSSEDQKKGESGGNAEPHPKHKHRRRRAHNGKNKGKKERSFHASSNSEVFYRTKVAQAEKTVEALQKLHIEEEKQKEKLRSRWKREQVHRKAMEKEMDIMRMKLAAAGLE